NTHGRKKLSAWAAEHGVHYRTALAWVLAGTFPHPIERTPGGHIRVLEEAPVATKEARVALYARVSSSEQKSDLARQSDRLRVFAAGRGWAEVEVVEEIGSGLNGERRSRAVRTVQRATVQRRRLDGPRRVDRDERRRADDPGRRGLAGSAPPRDHGPG